jgi:hypothetical protein
MTINMEAFLKKKIKNKEIQALRRQWFAGLRGE